MESDQADIFVTITSFFERNAIPYMITGAWSVIYYGRPRASHDLDFVVDLDKKDLPRLFKCLKHIENKFLFQLIAIEHALNHKDLFQLVHKKTFLKIDCWVLQEDAFDIARFARKQHVQAFGQKMWIASAEDTILQKLRWYKEAKIEKHLIDAVFVYQIQKEQLDTTYLSRWAKKLGVTPYLTQVGKINLEEYI